MKPTGLFVLRPAGLLVLAALFVLPAWASKPRPAWVIPNTAIVRAGPGLDHARIGSLHRGTKVYVVAFRDKWCRVKLPNGGFGWVAEWLLEFSAAKGRKLAAQAAQSGSSKAKSAGGKAAWIKASAVNVRSGPGLGYQRYGTLRQGTKVYVVARKSGWCKCRTPGGMGWIRGDLLTFHRPEQSGGDSSSGVPSAKGFIAGTNVRLREKPSTNSRIIATLDKGQTVYVVARCGDWYRLRVHGGNAGYVHCSLVKLVGSKGSSASKPAAAKLPPAKPDFPSPRLTPISLYEPPGKKPITVQAWVAGDNVNLRAGPGLGTAVKRKLGRGTRVVVTGLRGHWVYARLDDGTTGWIAGWLLNYTNPRQCHITDDGGECYPVRVGWVARPEVNLRLGPGLDYPEVAEATLGTKFIVLQRSGQWYRAAFSNGMVAWVASWLVDTREQRLARRRRLAMIASGKVRAGSMATAVEQAAADVGQRIVQLAMRFLGYPYVHGGESPSGFDCSGFVRYIMRQFGINASHDTRALYRQGRPVARDELKPGDIVFFRNTYRRGISHVGIYIGDDKFIHASTRRTGVRISSLNKPFYAKRYAGARRLY